MVKKFAGCGYAIRRKILWKSFSASFLLVFAISSTANSELFFATLAIFPVENAKGCTFVLANDPESHKAIEHFRPSAAFMKVACSHFKATWYAKVPAQATTVEYETVVWHKESPDAPTFLKQVDM